ncbi:MAG: hypothetical protein HC919_09645 [Oscillatoriales cyanobacterium SM2_2_1]|nr:hypothetical protein [Oscillatoriales cyanobacterium SM2_2_1]
MPLAWQQLPLTDTLPEFGEVTVCVDGDRRHVVTTILMLPQGTMAEGWRTGIALDGSVSMGGYYGRRLQTRISPALLRGYVHRRQLHLTNRDQELGQQLTIRGLRHLQRCGVRFYPTANSIQAIARELVSFLATVLDQRGQTRLVYWGCGNGDSIEPIGEFSPAVAPRLDVPGPSVFGQNSYLLPALRYFVERERQARQGLYLFVTDGYIADLEAVIAYTRTLARAIAEGKRPPLKCVLLGVGMPHDVPLFSTLDHLDTPVDIWDAKWLWELEDWRRILAEIVSPREVVAETARVWDANGNCVQDFPCGLPPKLEFTLPRTSPWFELEVAGQRLRQWVEFPTTVARLPERMQSSYHLRQCVRRDRQILGIALGVLLAIGIGGWFWVSQQRSRATPNTQERLQNEALELDTLI